MKKRLFVIVAVLLIFALTVPAFADDEETPPAEEETVSEQTSAEEENISEQTEEEQEEEPIEQEQEAVEQTEEEPEKVTENEEEPPVEEPPVEEPPVEEPPVEEPPVEEPPVEEPPVEEPPVEDPPVEEPPVEEPPVEEPPVEEPPVEEPPVEEPPVEEPPVEEPPVEEPPVKDPPVEEPPAEEPPVEEPPVQDPPVEEKTDTMPFGEFMLKLWNDNKATILGGISIIISGALCYIFKKRLLPVVEKAINTLFEVLQRDKENNDKAIGDLGEKINSFGDYNLLTKELEQNLAVAKKDRDAMYASMRSQMALLMSIIESSNIPQSRKDEFYTSYKKQLAEMDALKNGTDETKKGA